MTAMPDLVKAPPRPAASSAATGGGASAKDPQEGGFADLLDDAANEGTSGPDAPKPRPKAPKPDAASGAVPDGGEPVIPWLAAPVQAVATPAPGGEATLVPTVPAPATGTAGLTPETPDTAPPQAGTGTAPSLPGAGTPGAGKPEQAAQGQATASAAPQPPTGDPANPLVAQVAAPSTDVSAGTPPAPPPSGPVAAAVPPNGAPALAPSSSETAETVVNTATEPRRAGRSGGRGTKDAGRQGPDNGEDSGNANPAAIARAIAGQAAGNSRVATANGDPVTGFTAPTTSGGSSGTPTPGGFDTLLTLPGQAAAHYAAAPGRTAATHVPAMAQLAAPLVRVAEAGGGEFHIDLAPAELGRIRVVADVSDGHVTLAVQAENADTLALLRRDLQQLEKALGDAGLKLDNATLNFSLQGDGQSRGFAAPDQGGGGSRNAWRGAAGLAVADAPIDHAPRPIDGLVDVTI